MLSYSLSPTQMEPASSAVECKLNSGSSPLTDTNESNVQTVERPVSPPLNNSNEIEEGELPAEENAKATELDEETSTGVQLLEDISQTLLSPRKPVLGKEKAKQRLKALGIQKKIQMESRINTTSKKQKLKATTDCSSGSGSGGAKKDRKLLSPHEKAQLTIKEIEVMKREEEKVKIPIYYNEAMIHRITADSFDDSKTSTSQPTVTPSLEAIKCYDDEDNREGGTTAEERRHKRAKPEAYRRRRRSTSSPFPSKGKLKPRRERRVSSQHDSAGSRRLRREMRRSRDQRSQNSLPSDDGQAERLNRQLSFVIRPGGGFRPEEFHKTNIIRYTRTKPVISFACNPLSRAATKHKFKTKSRKKLKKKRSLSADENDERSSQKKKRTKKKKRSSGKKAGDNFQFSSKKSKKKSKKSTEQKGPKMGVLSFAVDDFNFEEDVDEFPIAKEEPQELSQTEESVPDVSTYSKDVPPLSTSIPISAVLSNVDENSPDTDDYLPNWEEEDEDSSKDEISIPFPLRKESSQSGMHALDGPPSSVESGSADSNSESVKDGLGTPIFVNPSPPDEVVASMTICNLDEGTRLNHDYFELSKDRRLIANEQQGSEEEILTPPPPQSKHLFEMENIYEQFLQSVREDPDFKDHRNAKGETSDIPKLTTEDQNNSSDEEESGFLSQSVPVTPSSSSTSSHSPSSNSSSSKSNDTSDTDSTEKESIITETPHKKRQKKRRKSLAETAEHQPIMSNVDDEDAISDTDELSEITSEDLKKLHSLQKRRGMLKMIRQQIDGMDEEDRQCLLGLEKLIRAERHMLLRKQAIRRLHLRKKILGTDSEESKDEENTKSNGFEFATLSREASDNNGTIFDGKREAIKMTITNKNSSPMKKVHTPLTKLGMMQDSAMADDDQDFTERLMKPKDSSKPKCSLFKLDERPDDQKTNRRSERCGRSLSLSPMRRSHVSSNRDRSAGRSKKRDYSPSTSRSLPRRHKDKTSSRSHRSRRFSRSPPLYRPSSSPNHSRSSSSRSPSRSPPPLKQDTVPINESPDQVRVPELYPAWSIERYSQYYIAEGYYYPRIPPVSGSNDKAESAQHRYPNSYEDYSQYNAIYANEYMNPPVNYPSGYPEQSEYAELHRPTNATANDSNSYLTIPVISSSDNYFFKREFNSPTTTSLANRKISNAGQHNTEILHHDDTNTTPTKPFAVQKGNVLEIVPATTISTVIPEVASMEKSTTSEIKQEPAENDSETQENLNAEHSKEDGITDIKSSTKKGHSWRNEVARRHVVSAVMRLNKETEDSPRGILKNKGNSTTPVKEKKKVLFADGIPPGRTSSASSDEEATLKFIRKRLKKKQRRMMSENKENELLAAEADITEKTVEAKIDPELWDAPPPPPPPGSPPPHLPQPILIRPASPEELLYFHFDPVYNMMYVSPMENAIPPRLLQNNGKSAIKPNIDNLPNDNGDTTMDITQSNKTMASPHINENSDSNSPQTKDDTTPDCAATEDVEETDEKQSAALMDLKESETPPPLPSIEEKDEATPPSTVPIGSPPQPIQNIMSMRMNSNSPLSYSQGTQVTGQRLPSPYESPQPPQSQSPQSMSSQLAPARPPIPIMVGYPGQIFARLQNRRPSPNIVRGPYNMPPPSTLHNRAFNPHIPPPFPPPPPSGNGPPPPSGYDSPGGSVNLPPSVQTHSSQPPPFNPNIMMYSSPPQPQQLSSPHSHPLALPPRPQNFNYGGPTPPPPHMIMNRPPNCFSAIPPPPVAMPNFIHGSGGVDRTASPRVGSPRHLFRVPPPQQSQQLPPQQPPTTPPGTPYV